MSEATAYWSPMDTKAGHTMRYLTDLARDGWSVSAHLYPDSFPTVHVVRAIPGGGSETHLHKAGVDLFAAVLEVHLAVFGTNPDKPTDSGAGNE